MYPAQATKSTTRRGGRTVGKTQQQRGRMWPEVKTQNKTGDPKQIHWVCTREEIGDKVLTACEPTEWGAGVPCTTTTSVWRRNRKSCPHGECPRQKCPAPSGWVRCTASRTRRSRSMCTLTNMQNTVAGTRYSWNTAGKVGKATETNPMRWWLAQPGGMGTSSLHIHLQSTLSLTHHWPETLHHTHMHSHTERNAHHEANQRRRREFQQETTRSRWQSRAFRWWSQQLGKTSAACEQRCCPPGTLGAQHLRIRSNANCVGLRAGPKCSSLVPTCGAVGFWCTLPVLPLLFWKKNVTVPRRYFDWAVPYRIRSVCTKREQSVRGINKPNPPNTTSSPSSREPHNVLTAKANVRWCRQRKRLAGLSIRRDNPFSE